VETSASFEARYAPLSYPTAKENAEQTTASQTQSWGDALRGLRGVREAAKRDKRLQFTALLHHVSVVLLESSFYALKRDAAPGVDGVTWTEYETGLGERLKDLHSRVHRGTYRAQPSKRAYILKQDGRQRPLGIAGRQDRPARSGDGPQSDLRRGLSGVLLWFPTRATPA
jgi:RNA-directed DNA polymerase